MAREITRLARARTSSSGISGRRSSSSTHAARVTTIICAALSPCRCASRAISDETLAAIVGLNRELARREREAIATPEEARRANTELRDRMREVMRSDYATLSAAQGLGRVAIALRHGPRNAALPAVTLQFAHLGELFGGSILALASISVQTRTTVAGRVLARNGQVSLDTNVITRPACAPVGSSATMRHST